MTLYCMLPTKGDVDRLYPQRSEIHRSLISIDDSVMIERTVCIFILLTARKRCSEQSRWKELFILEKERKAFCKIDKRI